MVNEQMSQYKQKQIAIENSRTYVKYSRERVANGWVFYHFNIHNGKLIERAQFEFGNYHVNFESFEFEIYTRLSFTALKYSRNSFNNYILATIQND